MLDCSLPLKSLIDESLIVAAQRNMSNLLNLSVVTIDRDGNILGDTTPFCQLICPSNRNVISCRKKEFVNIVNVKDTSQVYDCHIGLRNCISPIIVDNVLLGTVIIGPFVSKGEEYKKDQLNIEKLSKESSIEKDKIQEAVFKIPVASQENILNYLRCCEFLSSYFSEIASKNIIEKKLLIQIQEKLKFEKEAKKAKLKTLEAQINPHFLFNTLNSITRMAFLENSPNTEEMIYCLSGFLRYTLKQNEEFPTIDSELQNIKRYLYIQSLRYKDRINYSIDIADELLNYRIPSMILQPIVENAIIHGLEPKVEGGNIHISSEIRNGNIKIFVEDTGIGISPKKINELLNTHTETPAGLGIHSSHHRLNAYFGSEYGLKIYGNKNTGTVVEIYLPCFKELSPSLKS